MREAIQTIILADVVMSLDNILAVAGAAHGDIRLLIFGLLLSIPILLFGSELVARLLGRFPAFLYLGVFVLVHAAVAMILHDPTVARPHSATTTWQEFALSLAITAAIVGIVRLLERSRNGDAVRVGSTAADPTRVASRQSEVGSRKSGRSGRLRSCYDCRLADSMNPAAPAAT